MADACGSWKAAVTEDEGDLWLLFMCSYHGLPFDLNSSISDIPSVISLISQDLVLVGTLIRACGCVVLSYAPCKLCRHPGE